MYDLLSRVDGLDLVVHCGEMLLGMLCCAALCFSMLRWDCRAAVRILPCLAQGRPGGWRQVGNFFYCVGMTWDLL